MKTILTLAVFLFLLPKSYSQTIPLQYIPAEIDFSHEIVSWDGFGFNYVEASQTRDYEAQPQDYGGFSLLDEKSRSEISELVFGEKGLQVEIVKMFLDPWHQSSPDGEFDHLRTTSNMLDFVGRGLNITRDRGEDLNIITTLYGPASWATQQNFIGGRDFNPEMDDALCNYMISWVSYLRSKNFPVNFLSLHNEGEDFYRWDFSEGTQRFRHFDYNMYWTPELVNHFLGILPEKIKDAGLGDLGLTNGEPSNWTRFYHWGYSRALAEDKEALAGLSLITTHGFINGDFTKLSYGKASNLTNDLIREKKPGIHSWITSYSWGANGYEFLRFAHEHIYTSRVNALIPWAGIQNPSQWYDGDPNPGTAIQVNDDGSWEILPYYYFYKQLTTAGRKGMAAVYTMTASPQAFIIAFDNKGTDHPDAFVVTSNIFVWGLPLEIRIRNSEYTKFRAYRSSVDGTEKYEDIGIFEVENGSIIYDPPQGSATTFIGVSD